jgi:hypothetical protein
MKVQVPLAELAFTRSGDKGDRCNIGLMAKCPDCYETLKREVTPEKIKAFFKGMVKGEVHVYPMDNIHSLEVILDNALEGGATRTLRFDQTGKSMGCVLLRMEIEVEEEELKAAREAEKAILDKYQEW